MDNNAYNKNTYRKADFDINYVVDADINTSIDTSACISNKKVISREINNNKNNIGRKVGINKPDGIDGSNNTDLQFNISE